MKTSKTILSVLCTLLFGTILSSVAASTFDVHFAAVFIPSTAVMLAGSFIDMPYGAYEFLGGGGQSSEKGLLEKRAQLFEQMKQLGEDAAKEGRALTKEENDKFEKMDSDFNELTRSLENLRNLEKRNKAFKLDIEQTAQERGQSKDQVAELKEKRTKAFQTFLRKGINELTQEERTILSEMRAQSTTGSAGGYTIPEGFAYEIDKALKAYGGVMEVARMMETETGNDIPYPKYDDTSNVGELLAENTDAADQDITFGTTTIKSYKFSSKTIIVSDELMQDSAFNLEQLIIDVAQERIGRILNTYLTTGTGTSQPQGVVTASAAGNTAAGIAGITFDDILGLLHSVDPAYRKSTSAKFMMNDATLKLIKKISIGTNYTQPLWLPSIREGEPDTILNHKYVINQDMASFGANAKPMLFGDFDRFIVRSVKGMWIKRLAEKYAEQFSTGFVVGVRRDGRFVGTSGAIKHLLCPAS